MAGPPGVGREITMLDDTVRSFSQKEEEDCGGRVGVVKDMGKGF